MTARLHLNFSLISSKKHVEAYLKMCHACGPFTNKKRVNHMESHKSAGKLFIAIDLLVPMLLSAYEVVLQYLANHVLLRNDHT